MRMAFVCRAHGAMDLDIVLRIADRRLPRDAQGGSQFFRRLGQVVRHRQRCIACLCAGSLGANGQVGALVLDRLKRTDRLAELFAQLGLFDRDIANRSGYAGKLRRQHQPERRALLAGNKHIRQHGRMKSRPLIDRNERRTPIGDTVQREPAVSNPQGKVGIVPVDKINRAIVPLQGKGNPPVPLCKPGRDVALPCLVQQLDSDQRRHQGGRSQITPALAHEQHQFDRSQPRAASGFGPGQAQPAQRHDLRPQVRCLAWSHWAFGRKQILKGIEERLLVLVRNEVDQLPFLLRQACQLRARCRGRHADAIAPWIAFVTVPMGGTVIDLANDSPSHRTLSSRDRKCQDGGTDIPRSG